MVLTRDIGDIMVKCFVTGATGFIGSHITRLLTEKGHDVDVLVRKTSSRDLIEGLPVDTVIGDITDPDSLFAGISEDTEWLFHNAARMSDWGAKPRQWPINVGGTRNILEAARKKDIEQFIYTSSTALIRSKTLLSSSEMILFKAGLPLIGPESFHPFSNAASFFSLNSSMLEAMVSQRNSF